MAHCQARLHSSNQGGIYFVPQRASMQSRCVVRTGAASVIGRSLAEPVLTGGLGVMPDLPACQW